jgi:ribosomal protein S18 acetylase RimI-like enzyme
MQIDVRRIQPEDGPELKVARLAALTDSPSAFGATYAEEVQRTDDEWSDRAQWASSGTDRITLLARLEGCVVGIGGGYREHERPDQVDLVSMWIAPEARRAGVGQRLVLAVIDWATETGASSIGLWVTRGNAPAQLLYESMGF